MASRTLRPGHLAEEGKVTYVSSLPVVEVEYWGTGAEEPTRVTYPPEWVRPVEVAKPQ